MQRYGLIRTTVFAALLGIATAPAVAAGKIDFGKREYDSNCASCHGADGRGQGPSASFLNRQPADLTTLAKRNGGVFPISRMYDSIEGSGVPAHGAREMPIWGADYRVQAAEHYVDVPYDPQAYVRFRILSLIDYLYRLQAK